MPYKDDIETVELLREYLEGQTGVLGPFTGWTKKELANLFFTIYEKTYVTNKGNVLASILDEEGWLVDNTIIIKW